MTQVISTALAEEEESTLDEALVEFNELAEIEPNFFKLHFKELFALDGKHANLTVNDVQRRNRIARLLSDWGLVSIVSEDDIADIAPLNQIKVLSFRDKNDWILETKYSIGSKKKPN